MSDWNGMFSLHEALVVYENIRIYETEGVFANWCLSTYCAVVYESRMSCGIRESICMMYAVGLPC